ncbi:MAG: hypothetical protein H6581_02575 [Bacteroidia bacterium]|nr:hypothetical protein [Bacteroidia bacterium]
MSNLFRFKTWQLALIFVTPLLIMALLLGLTPEESNTLRVQYYTIFPVLTLMLITGWQTGMGYAYGKEMKQNKLLFLVPGALSLVCLLALEVYGLYFLVKILVGGLATHSIPGAQVIHPKTISGAVLKFMVIFPIATPGILLKIMSSLQTAIPDPEVRAQMKSTYLKPMQMVVIGMYLLIGLGIVGMVALDIASLSAAEPG